VTPSDAFLLAGGLGALAALRGLGRDRRIDLTPLVWLRAPLNPLAFALRRSIGWSRGEPALPGEPKGELFSYLGPGERERAAGRERELRDRYDLGPLYRASSCAAYRENLYVLDVFDREVAPLARGARLRRGVDVGSKDFVYAFALERFLRRHAGRGGAELVGVEIDGHVVYRDLRSRADRARANAARAGNPRVRYEVADFLTFEPGPVDLVTIFYPFVTRFALLAWGLPLSAFRPGDLFARAASSLAPGGLLVVFNHTHEERDAQLALAAEVPGLRLARHAPLASAMVDYHAEVPERTVSVFRREL
jgi:SAM-dependent methyltransferase